MTDLKSIGFVFQSFQLMPREAPYSSPLSGIVSISAGIARAMGRNGICPASITEEGVTIVMITHDPRIAAKAKRIVRIAD